MTVQCPYCQDENMGFCFEAFIPVYGRAPNKERFLFSRKPISSPNPMFDHQLESDTNKWSNIGFGEEITQVDSTEVNFI